jgi:hypothetical protein
MSIENSESLDQAIRKQLLSSADVANRITNRNGTTRYFPLFIPQGEDRPAIYFELDGADRGEREHGGLVQAFFDMTISVDAFQFKALDELKRACRKQLDVFRGEIDGFAIRGVFLDDERQDFVPPPDGKGEGFSEHLLEWRIWYREVFTPICA